MTQPVLSDLADFDVRANGAAWQPQQRDDVRSLRVEEDLDGGSTFAIELSNWDLDTQGVTWSDTIAIGTELNIQVGYLDDLHPVLLGEITSLEPAFGSHGPPVLTIAGYGFHHRLARVRRTRTFARMKDSAIAQQIARESGLRATVTDTKITLGYVMQANQTDWAFLRQRADRIGYEVFVRDKVLHLRPPGHAGAAAARLTLGEEISEFRPRLTAVDAPGEVTVRGWDVKQKAPLAASARSAEASPMGARQFGPAAADRVFGKSGAVVVDLLPGSAAEASSIARGRLDTQGLGYVRGRVSCDGNPRLRAGTVVEIAGAGSRFSGPYYVTAVTHTMEPDQGYRTDLTVERNAV